MPIYAQCEVPFLGLLDPLEKTFEVYRLKDGERVVAGLFKDDVRVRAEPFTELEIDLSEIWRRPRQAQCVNETKSVH